MQNFILSLMLLLSATQLVAAGLYSPLDVWNGEYMQTTQGAVYMRFQAVSFKAPTRGTGGMSTNVFMNFANLANGKKHVLHQAATSSGSEPLLVWKLPAGRYRVESITVNEPSGLTRRWSGARMPTFSVRAQYLSNLGEVALQPFSRQGLKVTFRSAKDRFVNPHSHQSFVAVLDGYTDKVQTTLGGMKLMRAAKDNFSTALEARSAFSSLRQISMVYRLDSTGNQTQRSQIAKTLDAQDSDLRQCYTEQLDIVSGLRGSVSFDFQISPRNRSIDTLKYTGGNLVSPKAIECLNLTLRRMQFPLRQRMVGRLNFQFDYKEEQGRARFP